MLQAFFDLRGDTVAGADLPVVQPDAEAVRFQTVGAGRTVGLSLELWLRKTSKGKTSLMGVGLGIDGITGVSDYLGGAALIARQAWRSLTGCCFAFGDRSITVAALSGAR